MIVGIEQLYLSPDRLDRRIPKVPLALARQVSDYGQVTPVVVRPGRDRTFEILSNVETWLAVQQAGLHSVDIFVHEGLEDSAAQHIINTAINQDPVTEAEWFKSQLQSAGQGGEFESIASLARSVGRSRTYVSHALRLLTLDDTLKQALRSGALDAGHAKALLAVENQKDRFNLATGAIQQKWSVRTLEKKIKLLRAKESTQLKSEQSSPDIAALERKLSEILGSGVSIDMAAGSLVIDYRKNMDVLDGILSRIGYRT